MLPTFHVNCYTLYSTWVRLMLKNVQFIAEKNDWTEKAKVIGHLSVLCRTLHIHSGEFKTSWFLFRSCFPRPLWDWIAYSQKASTGHVNSCHNIRSCKLFYSALPLSSFVIVVTWQPPWWHIGIFRNLLILLTGLWLFFNLGSDWVYFFNIFFVFG